MGKKKDGKSGGFRIPKEIGGVKLPKELRRKGEDLIAKANSPAGREMLAAGLAMAATAAAAAATRQRRASNDEAPPRDGASRPGTSGPGEPGMDPRVVADAVGNAAEAMMARFFGARRPG